MVYSKKKVYIISQFARNFNEYHSFRYNYIFKEALKFNDCILVTSTFEHNSKKRKDRLEQDNIKFIYEPGYRKNLSIVRVLSHFIFGLGVFVYLLIRVKKNDYIFAAIPANSIGFFAALVKKVKKANLIIDIHDTWPESLVPIFSKDGVIYQCFFRLWAGLRNYGIANCDLLMGESEEYVSNFQSYLKKGVQSHVILLGYERKKIEEIPSMCIREMDEKVNVVFAGKMGVNYDLDTIVAMVKSYAPVLREIVNIHFMGSGEKLPYLKQELKEFEQFVFFWHPRPYIEYISILKGMDVGINSFTKDTNVKYSYKSTDYLATGLVVLNNVQGSFADDVERYNLGRNYDAGDPESLYDNLIIIIKKLQKNRFYFKSDIKNYTNYMLDRAKIYKPLFSYLKGNVRV